MGCGLCETVCPHGVLRLSQRKAHIVDLNGCMECGACALNCPTQAIQVTTRCGVRQLYYQRLAEGFTAVEIPQQRLLLKAAFRGRLKPEAGIILRIEMLTKYAPLPIRKMPCHRTPVNP